MIDWYVFKNWKTNKRSDMETQRKLHWINDKYSVEEKKQKEEQKQSILRNCHLSFNPNHLFHSFLLCHSETKEYGRVSQGSNQSISGWDLLLFHWSIDSPQTNEVPKSSNKTLNLSGFHSMSFRLNQRRKEKEKKVS